MNAQVVIPQITISIYGLEREIAHLAFFYQEGIGTDVLVGVEDPTLVEHITAILHDASLAVASSQFFDREGRPVGNVSDVGDGEGARPF